MNGQQNGHAKSITSKTDYRRWRLKDDRGRQTWHYLTSDEEIKQWPQTIADKYHLGLDTVCRENNLQIDRHASAACLC